VVAVTFKSAVDDPSRIAKSKAVGALFGLTPKKYQSGEKDVTGGITRTGDEMVRTALYEAANVLLSRWPDNIHDRSRIRHQSHSGPEMGICSHRDAARQWSRLALVVVPGFILSPLWVLAVSADIAAWRLLEGEIHPREHFDPLWKLAYMWEHPLHFPLAAWTAVTVWGDRLWPELIGILGWQDILLRPWNYFVLTVFLLLVPLQKLNLDGTVRTRVAVITGLAAFGYVVTVYLIFFLTYTPLNIDHVRGVQGRYFVIALPMAAIFLASVINSDLPRRVIATMAITGSLMSGIASFQALLGAHWSVP
jgi:hypothetical protein